MQSENGREVGAFNLLYPQERASGQQHGFLELDLSARRDLGFEHVLAAFGSGQEHQKEIQKVFSSLPCDPDVIAYRQDVLGDLLAHPELVKEFDSLLPVIDSLFQYSYRSVQEMKSFHEVIWRTGELQNIVDCFEGMAGIFRAVDGKLKSRGLQRLKEEVHRVRNDQGYQSLVRELPGLLSKLRACSSVTIGVNLDTSLRPVQATLLSVNTRPFTDQSPLNKLFGVRTGREGIAPLHSVPKREVKGQYALPIGSDLGWAVEPLMVPLFADLAKVLEKTTEPIAKEIGRYADIQSRLLLALRQGLIYYLGAVRLIRHLQKLGLPVCRPRIAPAAERRCETKDSYNVLLALNRSGVEDGTGLADIITNDVAIGEWGRILILTGPNRGGKTTYMQGVGLIYVLTQVGCYVPGSRAVVSPIDHLLTHFPLEEKPDTDTGRFGEEAQRLAEVFRKLTRYSLVLLNESLTSTSFGESLYLAQDIVRMLRRVGACAVYSTHFHELANEVDELNASVPGDSKIISLVSSPVDTDSPEPEKEIVRTYKIEIRPPLGQSYAREIAERYGVSYQQLEKLLSERGVL